MNDMVVNSMSKSIIHVLNSKIQNIMPIQFNRRTENYNIFYEQKVYSIHKLIIKVQKGINVLKDNVDININVYNRLTIKSNANQAQLMLRPDEKIDKTIAMRITKTKYSDLQQKFVNFVQLYEKLTWVGAEVRFLSQIPECGMIVKDTETCYKTISVQKANTHWMNTILVVKPSSKPIKVGKLEILTSLMNYYEKDVYA